MAWNMMLLTTNFVLLCSAFLRTMQLKKKVKKNQKKSNKILFTMQNSILNLLTIVVGMLADPGKCHMIESYLCFARYREQVRRWKNVGLLFVV